MKKNPLKIFLIPALMALCGGAARGQNPGGIVTDPAVWYKSDGVSSTSWTDAMGQLNLTAVGSGGLTAGTVAVNPGDAGHNFNSWTTGYSSSSYYNWTSNTNPVFGVYGDTTGNYHYSPLTIFAAAKATSFTTATHQGTITGIDRPGNPTNAEEPGFDLIYSGGQVYPRFLQIRQWRHSVE